ncbi:hypothetical protein EYF80_044159 [Liparis tanakae]|uniref:Uncharacterized protein n=1 Tax=Liparis tanakae TaxID=230148 RepID=A0A4Z2FYK4_9TELE|nr:hypothetical protein EYF80_044159 [Liparis tanakae]
MWAPCSSVRTQPGGQPVVPGTNLVAAMWSPERGSQPFSNGAIHATGVEDEAQEEGCGGVRSGERGMRDRGKEGGGVLEHAGRIRRKRRRKRTQPREIQRTYFLGRRAPAVNSEVHCGPDLMLQGLIWKGAVGSEPSTFLTNS